jgi:hypothetical protein
MIFGLLLFGIPSAIVASNKGFAALRWVIAFGLIGLIVVCSLKSAKAPDITPEDAAVRVEKANNIGGWMCGINIGLGIISLFYLLAMLSNSH